MAKLLNIGFGNVVNMDKVVAVVSPDAAPIKRLVQAAKRLMEKYDNYALSVSATTRAPRPGEEHGREYFFHTKKEFEELILEDALIEYAQYVDNYYGTPKAYVEKQLNMGKDVILEIEIQGALKVKKKMPNTLLLFVTPPSAEELKRRLVNRGTESMEVIESRLSRASEEAEGMLEYDYILINDVIEDCVDNMHNIIQSQHDAVKNRQEFIKEITEEIAVFKKGE